FIVTTLSSLRPTLYIIVPPTLLYFLLFFFNYTSTTEIYTLSLHDALPISTLLYFASNRAGGPGMNDIYVSTLQADGTFGSAAAVDRKSTRLNSSHEWISYAVFCLKKKKKKKTINKGEKTTFSTRKVSLRVQ